MTTVQVCHHAFPRKHLETTEWSRTKQREALTIDWELVVPLLITVEPLNDHCVFICVHVLQKLKLRC